MGQSRPRGSVKTPGSGRQKGTPNKKTLTLIQKCEDAGVDPFQVLLELCKNPDPAIKLSAAKEVCQYILPKRKAIEITDAKEQETGFEDVSSEDLENDVREQQRV